VKNLRPCLIGGIAYPSQSAAADALGVTRQRVHQLVVRPHDGRRTQANCRPVMIDNVSYSSIADAAKELGVSYWSARYFAKLGTLPRQRKRRTASPKATTAPPQQPPMRNAMKTLQRIIVVLETSTWIARLPHSQLSAIAKAREILREQENSLRGEILRMSSKRYARARDPLAGLIEFDVKRHTP
jgi:hypothetical protein